MPGIIVPARRAVQLINDDEAAMEQLLERVRRNLEYRDAVDLRGLHAILGILGEDDALAARYRARLEETTA
jgi:thioredoxin-like negative regulator of GroEL